MYAISILAQDSGSGGSPLALLFFLVIPVAMYFLMIRPQTQAAASAGRAAGVDRHRRRGRHELRHLRLHHRRGGRQVLARDRRRRADPHRQGGDPGQGRRRHRPLLPSRALHRARSRSTPPPVTTPTTRTRSEQQAPLGVDGRRSRSIAVALFALTVGFQRTPILGLDLKGGLSVIYATAEPADQDELIVVRDLMRDQLESFGIAEPDVRVEGKNIIVDLPGVSDQSECVRRPQGVGHRRAATGAAVPGRRRSATRARACPDSSVPTGTQCPACDRHADR